MLQNKKQATIVDCFLREGYTTPGYPIRPLVSSSLQYTSRGCSSPLSIFLNQLTAINMVGDNTNQMIIWEGNLTPGYSIRLVSSSLEYSSRGCSSPSSNFLNHLTAINMVGVVTKQIVSLFSFGVKNTPNTFIVVPLWGL